MIFCHIKVKCWGFTDTPSFVGEPECNGCAERFMRTLRAYPTSRHTMSTAANCTSAR